MQNAIYIYYYCSTGVALFGVAFLRWEYLNANSFIWSLMLLCDLIGGLNAIACFVSCHQTRLVYMYLFTYARHTLEECIY